MPTNLDIVVWRGNNAPGILWPLSGDVHGSSFRLTVSDRFDRAIIHHDATEGGGLLLDPTVPSLLWDIALDDSRLIPTGALCHYEIEQRDAGSETTLFYGAVTGKGGVNDDADPSQAISGLDFSNPDNSGLQLMGWI